MRLTSLLFVPCVVACTGRSVVTEAGFDATIDARSDASTDASAPPDDGSACTSDVLPEPALPVRAPHTPRWMFEPWISKDISTTDDTYAFVQGFRDRDIPVGVVVLDSPWETQYHTFVPSPTRYHDFERLVRDLHTQNVRIVLWMTQMVNLSSYDLEAGGDTYTGPSPNFAEGRQCGFYVERGRIWNWWKGRGAGVDFFNPRARAWWHAQQDAVLAAGIDGWKLDFGESYVGADPVETAAGPVSFQAYSEAYYRDFLAYGALRRGEDFATMVRGWDGSYDFAGRFFARPEDAPAAWMGDNRRDWFGLADALDEMFRSSRAGYVVVGSDIGGYLDLDDRNLAGPQIPFSQTVFARWTAVGALSPFMQLHGRANLAPWTVPDRPDETVALYRYWATLHHELVPFFASLAEQGYAAGPPFTPIVRPIGDASSWAGDYRYTLGDAFLVAPVLDDSGFRDVALPGGARWYDWWSPASDAIPGGTTLARFDSTDRARVPLFVREGALIPVEVSSPLTGLGAASAHGALTVLVYPAAAGSDFSVTEADGTHTQIHAARDVTGGITVDVIPVRRRTVLRVRADFRVTGATRNGATIATAPDRAGFETGTGDFYYDASARIAWVRIPAPVGVPTGTTRIVLMP